MRVDLFHGGKLFVLRALCSAGDDVSGAPGTGGGGGSPPTSPSPSSPASSGNAGSSSAPGAPAPSPSGTPSAAVVPPNASDAKTPAAEPDGSFNFDGIFSVDPEAELGLSPKPDVAQQPAQQPQPLQQPEPGTPPPAQAAPTVDPAAPATPSPGEPSPAPAPMDAGMLAQGLMQHEAQAIEHLAAEAFKFSPEELQAIDTDVIGALPKLMAKVMVKTQAAMFSNMARLVPAMIQKHLESTAASTKAEDQFFGAFPALKEKPEHKELVARLAKSYRAANPQVPREQMIKDVGIMAMHAAGLPLTASGAPANGKTNANGLPAPLAPQPSPWQPAGAAPAVASTPSEGSPWDILGQHEQE